MSNNSDLEPRLPYTKVCSWPEPPPADQGEAASTTFAAASYWDYASDSVSSASTAGFDSTRAKVQEKFDIEAKPWQIGVINDIVQHKRDLVALLGTNVEKTLLYQAISVITGGTILVVSPTTAIMEDQCLLIQQQGISATALTSMTIYGDPEVWEKVEGKYDVVFVSPGTLLGARSVFWQRIQEASEFCQRLACIVIDEAHLVWGWRDFRKDYRLIGHLKDSFPHVPAMVLSAVVTPTVLEYICTSLKLTSPTRIYTEFLDHPNLTYVVAEVTKRKYEELSFLVPSSGGVESIPKTMIFIDNVDEAIEVAMYLRTKLPGGPHVDKAKLVIRSTSSYLEPSTRSKFLEDFRKGNTRILVCAECAVINLDIPDITRIVQWKIPKRLTFAVLIQRLGRAGMDALLPAVALVFVEKKHILPDDMHEINDSDFKNSRAPVEIEDWLGTSGLVAALYKNNLPTTREKTGSVYGTIDPAILWLINSVGCRRRLILACIMCETALRLKATGNCCDNCLYTGEDKGPPEVEIHDVSLRISMRYRRNSREGTHSPRH